MGQDAATGAHRGEVLALEYDHFDVQKSGIVGVSRSVPWNIPNLIISDEIDWHITSEAIAEISDD